MIEVRDAVAADADLIAIAQIEGWRAGYRGLLPDAYLDAPSFAQQRIDRWHGWANGDGSPTTPVSVAVVDGEVVGFGLCGAEHASEQDGEPARPTGRGQVFAFYLRPSAWGSGAAAPLMAHCRARLRAAGHTEAVLWVLRDNPRARRFYEREGWSATGPTSLFEGSVADGEPAFAVVEVQYARSLE